MRWGGERQEAAASSQKSRRDLRKDLPQEGVVWRGCGKEGVWSGGCVVRRVCGIGGGILKTSKTFRTFKTFQTYNTFTTFPLPH